LDKIRWSELAEKESIRLAKVSEYIISTILGGIDVSKYTDAYQLATALSIPVHTKKLERELTLISIPELMLNWAKENFNIASPKQLKTALDLMGIKTASTDKKVLKKLSKSEIVDALLEKSECAKRISTYGMGVLDFISTVSGRIHTEFLNMGTATGRFSSGNPINLQNIPVAPGYRESFIAQPDFEWISADYSQEEFRLTGAIANEPKIIEAYNSGADMHTATAAIIYNKTLSEVTKEERFVGKTANFAIIYGGTEYTLGKNLNISQEKSEEMLRSFKKGFPILSAFKDKAEEFIVKHGYSTTLLGRKRHSPQKPLYMNSREYMTFIQKIKREGFNHIIQGSAADIIKIAMVNIYTKNPFGDKFRMLIQVHDEINAEAHKSVSKDAAQFLKEEMLKAEQPFLKDIPAQVDVNISDHWIH
jgi:DNA polymerase-1